MSEIKDDIDENESIQYSVEQKYLNLLDKTSSFYVLKPENRFLPDTEKLSHVIKITKKSFKKIYLLSDTNFIEILSILEIVITKLRYEYFHSLLLSRSNFDPKLKRLLNNIESYSMNGKTPVSDYSVKKILLMGGFEERDLPSYMNIKELENLSSTEEKVRKNKIRRLSSKANRMKLNDSIKEGENLKYKIIENEDKSKKCEIQNINHIDNQLKEILNVYNNILLEIEDMKNEYHNEMEKKRNIFVEIEGNENNKEYIRKDYIELLKHSNSMKIKNLKKNNHVHFNINNNLNDNKEESNKNNENKFYEVENSNHEIVLIPKNNINNFKFDDKNIYFKIKSNNDNSTITLKSRINEALDNWKCLNQISNIPSSFPKNRWRKVQLKKMSFPLQEQIHHILYKEEIEEIKKKKKDDIIKHIKKKNNSFLEVNDNQLVNYNLINQVLNDTSEYDNFKVKEFLTNNTINISKQEIEKKYNNEDNYYIKLIDKSNGKNNIVNKKELLNAIINNKNLNEHILLTNYNNKKFIIKPKDILVEKINDNDIPFQPQKGEQINKELENDLKNTIIYKQIGNFLVPQKIIEDIEKDKSEINEYEVPAIENYNDDFYNPNSKTKINKKDFEKNEQLPEFIEIIYDINNEDNEIEEKKNLVSKKDLLKGINDNSKDEINLIDFVGNDINIRKSNIKIANNKNKEDNYKIERASKDYADELLKKSNENKVYQLIKDENKKLHLCDKSYINLILQHNPKQYFDKYEIPNINNETIKVSKSKIEKIKNPKNYISLVNTNNNEKNFFLIDDLKNEHEELSNENYLFTIYGKNSKIPIKVKDLNVSNDPKKIIFLPPQPEEAIVNIRNKFNDPKKDVEIIQVYDINNNPVLVFNSEIEEKKEENNINNKFLNSKSNGNIGININTNNNHLIKNYNNDNLNNNDKDNLKKSNNEKNNKKNPNKNYSDNNLNKKLINNLEIKNGIKEKELIIKDIHGYEKKIKTSSIKKDNEKEIYCMIVKYDEEILVNKSDLVNLINGLKSDIEYLIKDWLKKTPKDVDLLSKNRKQTKSESSKTLPKIDKLKIKFEQERENEKGNNLIFSFNDEQNENNNKETNKKKPSKNNIKIKNLELIEEDEKEDDKKNKEDKLNLGYNSAPDEIDLIDIILNDDNFDNNDNKKKVTFHDAQKKNKNNKNIWRRAHRSKSQKQKSFNYDMGIEYMLSRRKDKNIYNIRWKIVRQFVKKIKQYKK